MGPSGPILEGLQACTGAVSVSFESSGSRFRTQAFGSWYHPASVVREGWASALHRFFACLRDVGKPGGFHLEHGIWVPAGLLFRSVRLMMALRQCRACHGQRPRPSPRCLASPRLKPGLDERAQDLKHEPQNHYQKPYCPHFWDQNPQMLYLDPPVTSHRKPHKANY